MSKKYDAEEYSGIVLSPAGGLQGPIAHTYEAPLPFTARTEEGEIDPRTIKVFVGPPSQVKKAIGEMFDREAVKDAALAAAKQKKGGGRN